jgi:hypothetical protein
VPPINGVPRNFFLGGGGGGSTNSVEDRGVLLNLQMSETRVLIRLLRMYFPRNWEFGSVLSKPRYGTDGLVFPMVQIVLRCLLL